MAFETVSKRFRQAFRRHQTHLKRVGDVDRPLQSVSKAMMKADEACCGLCKASKQADWFGETAQEPSAAAGGACGGCEAARRWVASRNASMGRSAVRAMVMVAGLSRSMDANTFVA